MAPAGLCLAKNNCFGGAVLVPGLPLVSCLLKAENLSLAGGRLKMVLAPRQ